MNVRYALGVIALLEGCAAQPSSPRPTQPSPDALRAAPTTPVIAGPIAPASSAPALAESAMAEPPAPPPPPRPEEIASPVHAAWMKTTLDDIRPYCAVAVHKTDTVEEVGCACCPPFDACKPKGKAGPVEAESVFALVLKVDGAFSAPTAKESALVFDGCEPHAGNYGGTMLVSRADAPVRRRPEYRSGVHPSECVPLHAKGPTDRLLCRFDDAHMGLAEEQVFVYDFTKKEDAAWKTVFDAQDSMSMCIESAGVPLVEQSVRAMNAREVDGATQIELLVSSRKGVANAAYASACRVAMAAADQPTGGATPPAPGAVYGARELLTLSFLEKPDGSFEATAETKPRLAHMNEERSTFLLNSGR